MNLWLPDLLSKSFASGFVRRLATATGFGRWLLVLLVLASPLLAQTASNSPPREPYDTSNWLALLAAPEGGGGIGSGPSRPTAYGGIKLGVPYFTLDLGYDRVQARSGFSTEVSAMLPVWRYPKPQVDESKNFLRIYAEPGAGYRAGGGSFGTYASAKVMVTLLSDERLNFSKLSPFLEIQRRFPANDALRGDTRVAFGFLIALCNHCGLD
jgi:hypothetical protein